MLQKKWTKIHNISLSSEGLNNESLKYGDRAGLEQLLRAVLCNFFHSPLVKAAEWTFMAPYIHVFSKNFVNKGFMFFKF